MKKIVLVAVVALTGMLVHAKPVSTKWETHPKSYTTGVLVRCPHCSHYLPKPTGNLTAKEWAMFEREAKKHMKSHVDRVHGSRRAELKASRDRVAALVAKSSRKGQ